MARRDEFHCRKRWGGQAAIARYVRAIARMPADAGG